MSEPTATLSDGDVVGAFYDAYTDQAPERFAAIVAEDYIDYEHEPPGRGPHGTRDDFDHAAKAAGAIGMRSTRWLMTGTAASRPCGPHTCLEPTNRSKV
jgi:hypothetical protein